MHRIMLEGELHSQKSFVTLTYSDESLVYTIGSRLPTLVPDHLKEFLKRLRKAMLPSRVRFYAIGEYGDETSRPHYHGILFGVPPCAHGSTRMHRDRCCTICTLLAATWRKGGVLSGTFSSESAQYVAGYVMKKMGRGDRRLDGRYPEFSRQSLKPGIGVGLMDEVASTMLQFDLETTESDVPVALRHGKKMLPLGRFLRRKLRQRIGRDVQTPQVEIDRYQAEMSEVRKSAFDASENFQKALARHFEGHAANLEGREKIFRQRRKTL